MLFGETDGVWSITTYLEKGRCGLHRGDQIRRRLWRSPYEKGKRSDPHPGFCLPLSAWSCREARLPGNGCMTGHKRKSVVHERRALLLTARRKGRARPQERPNWGPQKSLDFWGRGGARPQERPNWGPQKSLDFWGRGGARERRELSPRGGSGSERTLLRRGGKWNA